MNKATIILTFLIAMTIKTFAQIPNAGFENWTNGSPDGWLTANFVGIFMPITKISQAHSGNYALRGDCLSLVFYPLGTGTEGFPINQRPASLTGYYKFSPAASSGDRFVVAIILNIGGLNGTEVASNTVALSGTADSYTQFSIPLLYLTGDVPNTCFIQFAIAGPSLESPYPTIGSYFILDDLAFDKTTGVEANQTDRPNEFKIFQNYPNPFNSSTSISFSLPSRSFVSLKIFDLKGKEVATIVSEELSAGTYSRQWNAEKMSSGIYLYCLQAGSFIETKRLILSR